MASHGDRHYRAGLRCCKVWAGDKAVYGSFGNPRKHVSSIIGIALSAAGGLMILLSYNRFTKDQEGIKAGKYEPSSGAELVVTTIIFIIPLFLIGYLFLTF